MKEERCDSHSPVGTSVFKGMLATCVHGVSLPGREIAICFSLALAFAAQGSLVERHASQSLRWVTVHSHWRINKRLEAGSSHKFVP